MPSRSCARTRTSRTRHSFHSSASSKRPTSCSSPHRTRSTARCTSHPANQYSTSGVYFPAARVLQHKSASDVCGRSAMKILITGASGFVCGYLIPELLELGHEIVGLDNHSKYGQVEKTYDRHPRYRLVTGDAKRIDLLAELLDGCDHFVAG